MSEKQAKKERQEERKVIAEFGIRILENGNVEVSGPIGNFFAFRDAMNRAERVVLNQILSQMKEKTDNRIIVPGMKVPPHIAQRMQ